MKKNILLGVTASIAAYKACDLVRALKKAGYEVTVVMTRDAQHFITPLTLQTLSCNPVVTDFFTPTGKPLHVKLAEDTHLVLVAPATADIIAKIAYGFADDALTCSVLASTAPLVVAPAMNDKMWNNPITQENVEKLRKRGATFVGPVEGILASGDKGMGHFADIESILKAVKKELSSPQSLSGDRATRLIPTTKALAGRPDERFSASGGPTVGGRG